MKTEKYMSYGNEIFNWKSKIAYADGATVSKVIFRNAHGNITLFAFDKGESLSEHSAPFDVLMQILEGDAKVIINKIEYELRTGDNIILPANIPHALFAKEKFIMLLSMVK